jgi:hypothetical protein
LGCNYSLFLNYSVCLTESCCCLALTKYLFNFVTFIFYSKIATNQSARTLMLQEYNGMTVLSENNVRVAPFGIATSAEEAFQQAMKIGLFNLFKPTYSNLNIGGKDYVVKAQVLAGGRGKGKFDSGLEGGVQLVFTYIFFL